MAAAVLTRTSNDSSLSQSKMSSPKDSKRNILGKNEDPPGKIETAEDDKSAITTTASTSNAQPLAPPPRPAQNGASDAPDYFNQVHSGATQFSLEPNPFEQSFGNPSTETPGKSILPPVASITSPSPLQGVTPGWSSLRSGPLSPAMLAGPQGSTDYFGESFRGGFPTPNESSLRTGLTPGGGGSMFPAPSPNSQALYNLQSGGATPSTLDFHRTALSAAQAVANQTKFNLPATSAAAQAADQTATAQVTSQPPASQQSQRPQQDLFNNAHDVNTAANDLLQFSSGARNGQFAVPPQPNQVNTNMPVQGQASTETSPTVRRNTKGSIRTSISGSVEPADQSESGNSEETKPANRTRGKKAPNNKAQTNRRKAEETPAKAPANKKLKTTNGSISAGEEDEEDSDDEGNLKFEGEINGRKMTDEEKRKNFLERNRVAALKCRQRKKQWLANLQAKVELFSTENDALSAQVTQLREEVVNLKTLLLAHKDCPVSQAQGLSGMNMSAFIGEAGHHTNPYGMAMQPNGIGIPMGAQGPGQMQRT